ncbi:MAG: hypothetical protein IKF64_07210 [Eubacterium sp.]|nr:hypothetical protein [Eubacterium sp.]
MRHFKRLSEEFLTDIKVYIDRYTTPIIEEKPEAVCQENEMPPEAFAKTTVCYSPSPSKRAPKSTGKSKAYTALGDTAAILLPEKQPTFQQNLFRLIDMSGKKDSAVYRRADIDRRLFSKIRADVNYHPSKSTAVKLCLALALDISETERLLETAGYCLSLSDTSDLVIRYCIEHKTYSLIEVNEALDYFGQDVL